MRKGFRVVFNTQADRTLLHSPFKTFPSILIETSCNWSDWAGA